MSVRPPIASAVASPIAKPGLLGAERWHQQGEQVRGQTDLGKQPEGHCGSQRQELAIAPEPSAGQRPRGWRRDRRRGRARRIAVGRQSHLSRRPRKHQVGEDPHREGHGGTDRRRRDRKSQEADCGHPERREDDAADAAAVVGHSERGRAGAHEPRRDNRVDGGCAHCAPACAAEQRRDEELPRRHRGGPAEHPDGQGRALQPWSSPATPRRRWIAGRLAPTDRADKEMHGDRARDEGERPAPRFADDAQEDRRTEEADSPAEHGQDKSSADDAPPVEAPALRPLQRLRCNRRRDGTATADGREMLRCGRSIREQKYRLRR